MSKLNKYNQVILSIIGTLGVFFLLSITYLASKDIRRDLIRSASRSAPAEGVIVENKTDESDNNLREQVVSFGSPRLLDSTTLLYLTTVTTRDLDIPEPVWSTALEAYDRNVEIPTYGISYKDYKRINFSDAINNIVLKSSKSPDGYFVFNKKVSVSFLRYEVIDNDHFLLLIVNDHDSDGDNKLTDNDQASFYLYDILERNLFAFPLEDHDLLGFERMFDSNEILLTYIHDRNEDKIFDTRKEPVILKTLTIGENQLKDYIAASMQQKIQMIIDGRVDWRK